MKWGGGKAEKNLPLGWETRRLNTLRTMVPRAFTQIDTIWGHIRPTTEHT